MRIARTACLTLWLVGCPAPVEPADGGSIDGSSFDGGSFDGGGIDGGTIDGGMIDGGGFDAPPVTDDGGTAASVIDISRDATSTLGGVEVSITGTGFTGTPSIVVDGVPATSVVVESSSLLRCVLPPHDAGIHVLRVAGVPLVNPRLAAVGLGGSVHYFPAPTLVFHDGSDFDVAGSLGSFSTDASGSGSATNVEGPAPEGRARFLRTSAPSGATHSVSVYDTFTTAPQLNVAALPTGVFMREYLRMSASAIARAEAGQIKLFLNRSRDSGAVWLHGGIGGQFPGSGAGRLGIIRDFDTGALEGGLPSDTGIDFVADTWYEIERHCRRDGAESVAALWVNGRLVAYEVEAALGTDVPTDRFMWELGLLFTQGTDGAEVMNVDVAAPESGNGWIEVAP